LRAVWRSVIAALKRVDFGEAVVEKSNVERAQRAMRAREARANVSWEPLLFGPLAERCVLFEDLGRATGWKLHEEQTKGVWKVDENKVTHTSRGRFAGPHSQSTGKRRWSNN